MKCVHVIAECQERCSSEKSCTWEDSVMKAVVHGVGSQQSSSKTLRPQGTKPCSSDPCSARTASQGQPGVDEGGIENIGRKNNNPVS